MSNGTNEQVSVVLSGDGMTAIAYATEQERAAQRPDGSWSFIMPPNVGMAEAEAIAALTTAAGRQAAANGEDVNAAAWDVVEEAHSKACAEHSHAVNWAR